jgi:membrane protein YdbS with pleckstrin-like domain
MMEPADPLPTATPSGPNGDERRLDPRYVPFQRAVGWIVTGVVSLALCVALSVLWLTGGLPREAGFWIVAFWVAATCGLAWFCQIWPAVEYRYTSYRLDSAGIEIHSGVVWREVKNVPRSRVQHIDVSQGPMERSYSLSRLVIYTAGTDHSRVELSGLDHAVAFELRNHLLPRGADDAI